MFQRRAALLATPVIRVALVAHVAMMPAIPTVVGIDFPEDTSAYKPQSYDCGFILKTPRPSLLDKRKWFG